MGGRGSASKASGLRGIGGLVPHTGYRYSGGRLQRRSVSGWHDEDDRAARNLGRYKVYARRFNAATPYTRYFVADTESGAVYTKEAQHYGTGHALKDLVDAIEGKSEAPSRRSTGFNPLEGI